PWCSGTSPALPRGSGTGSEFPVRITTWVPHTRQARRAKRSGKLRRIASKARARVASGAMSLRPLRHRSTALLLTAVGVPLAAVALLVPRAITDVLTAGGYMPHGHCYLWQPQLLALHGISDLLIGGSYLVISLTLAFIVYRARGHVPFHWMV